MQNTAPRSQTRNTPTRSGRALVWLRSGHCYEGQAEIVGSFVHFDGYRRVRTLDGVFYPSTAAYSWPQREVKTIRWIDHDTSALAA